MIVFAAHTPHTPLMLASIGKENRRKLEDTVVAMDQLAQELYAAHPDTLLIISSHATVHDTAFSCNLHDEYRTDFSAFGDLTTTHEFAPDLALIDAMQRSLRRGQVPFTLDSESTLDYGSSVALTMLAPRLPDIRVVPVSHSGLDAKTHFKFGQHLKDILTASNRRIAVVSSGDLSHCLSSAAPGGYKKEGEEFDASVVRAVESASASQLLTLDDALVREASECGFRPLLILLGILDGRSIESEILSYEAPFGVGYLTAQFHLL